MNKSNFKTMLLAGLMTLTGVAGFTACSDSDGDNNNGPSGGSASKEEVAFDDLSFFQDCIVRVDSLGQFMSRNYGEPLYENDTTNVYVGVETLEEARQMFDTWMAPDVKVTATPSTTNVTVKLTDPEGKPQGEVYFKEGTDGVTIAEVTTTAAVRHFRKVSFIPNSAWPHNVQEGKFTKGVIYQMSVRTHYKNGHLGGTIESAYEKMKMVCIRAQGNGIPPMLLSIGNKKILNDNRTIFSKEYTDLISESDAEKARLILQEDWSMFVDVFREAGHGPLLENEWYWINEITDVGLFRYTKSVNLTHKGESGNFQWWDGAWDPESFYPLYCKTTDFYMKYDDINYVECSWDDATKTVKAEEKVKTGYYLLSGKTSDFTEMEGKWYAVSGEASLNVLIVKGKGNHLILSDDSKLSLKHIQLPEGTELNIHGGPKGNGVLYVDNTDAPEGQGIDYTDGAGIGGRNEQTMGTLIIHGGNITVYGDDYAAGIGGGDAGHGGNIYVYGGDIKAYGGEDGAGIGGGEDGRGANITIYGGKIAATARYRSSSVGAAIGGGQDAGGGIFTMYGGDVYAEGGVNAAGIGGGEDGTSGPITIYGGKVRAYGGKSGAGIGSGFAANCNTVTIYGGDVEAHGGLNAAGIGTGEEGKTSNINSGTIDIRGGKVYAVGDGYGAGIGAGREATCGTIAIAGGRVDAHAGSACGPWSGGIGSYHSEHEDGCHIEWAGWQRIYIGACMRLWTYSPSIGVIENVHYTENWWNFTHQRPQVAYGECNHVDGAYDITNCPYCHSYTLTLQ